MQDKDNSQSVKGKGVLCLIEPNPQQLQQHAESEMDRCWILLHVLPHSMKDVTVDENDMVRMSNNSLQTWYEWKDSHVQELTGTLIFCESSHNTEDMLIVTMLIEKEWRRKGYGTQLVTGLKKLCQRQGRSRIVAATEFRAKALPFWRNVGLVEDVVPYIPVSLN